MTPKSILDKKDCQKQSKDIKDVPSVGKRTFLEGVRMDEIHDYFSCENCSNKDFKLVYNFSVRFHGVNFSDDLIYDTLTEEIYHCTKCNKAYTKRQIDERLTEFKRKRKGRG